MSISQSHFSQYSDRTNDQRHALVLGQAQCTVDTADPTMADQTGSHSLRGDVPFQDPFTYYRAFLSTESPSTPRSGVLGQHDDGDTESEFRPDAQSTQGQGEQQQSRPRPVPYNLAFRFANRSNGAPLATIIEQGSLSTLNSHGSLLSVGRFPSIRAVENASPGRASHRHSRSLDENALNRIQEELRDDTSHHDTDSEQTTGRRPGNPELYHQKATAACSFMTENPRSQAPQLPEVDLGVDTRSLKGFFRGVLSNVRNSTRNKSRSSSGGTNPPTLLTREPWSDISPSARTGEGIMERSASSKQLSSLSASTPLLSSTSSSPHHVPKPQVADRSSPEASKPSVGVPASTIHLAPSTFAPDTPSPSAPQLPTIRDLSRLRNGKEVLPSVCSVAPEPRDAALDHVRQAATTFLSRSRDELAARYTPDGAVVHRNDEWSLRDYARNSSRNASFCSTMSTSYSGTVLGIDLDLQHEIPHTTRRSVTPVWFSPKETAIKNQEPPKRELQLAEAKPLRPRSITSSALTSLLPIAAAEGIVQQNLNTPQLSFYSPSGNLIQAQDTSCTPTPASSSRSRSDSYFSGAPATSTSYYSSTTLTSAQAALNAAIGLPPARPAPVPLTTPPQPTAPLPEHLRYHHNYQHVEKSQIGSMSDSDPTLLSDVAITSGSNVRGCGGVIRPTSLNPHSGVPQQSPQKHSRVGQSMSCIRLGEARKFRYNLPAAWASINPWYYPSIGDTAGEKPRKKGRTLKKRQRRPHIGTESEHGGVGPVAGQALRICFCQPYDGAGKPFGEMGCGSAATKLQGECHSEACVRQTDTHEPGTPNARVVVSRDGSKGKSRARSDSAVSVGIRVGLVGG